MYMMFLGPVKEQHSELLRATGTTLFDPLFEDMRD